MSLKTFLFILGIILFILVGIFTLIYAIYKFVLIKFKQRTQDLTIEELFNSINVIVNNEISLYERNILDNGGKIITNASYQNYYKDIMENITKSLSPDIIARIGFYIKEEALITWISREVKIYLNSKIVWI